MYERRRVEHGRTSAEDVGTCGHGRKNLTMGARPLLCTSLAVSTILLRVSPAPALRVNRSGMPAPDVLFCRLQHMKLTVEEGQALIRM